MAKRGKGSVSIRELHEKTGELVRRAGASSVRRANCICRFLKACFYARATVYTSSRRCMKGSGKSARSIATSKRRCRHLVSLLLPSRGGDKEFVRLDAEDAEERYRLEPVEFLTPEKIFDARWAMTVLGEALKQLRQEYATAGKTSTFEALKAFLDPDNSIAPPSYDEVANRLQVATGAVKTLIHRLRKRYTALLRVEVGRTVSDPAEIDEEIHALCEALIATEGRLGP